MCRYSITERMRFPVSGIYLIGYDREFVILLDNLLVRLTVFRCFSVFHPLRSVLFHAVNVSVFGVLFWHFFCSLCCDFCAAAWVTVLYTVIVGVIFLVSLLLFISAVLLEGNVSLWFRKSGCSVR